MNTRNNTHSQSIGMMSSYWELYFIKSSHWVKEFHSQIVWLISQKLMMVKKQNKIIQNIQRLRYAWYCYHVKRIATKQFWFLCTKSKQQQKQQQHNNGESIVNFNKSKNTEREYNHYYYCTFDLKATLLFMIKLLFLSKNGLN